MCTRTMWDFLAKSCLDDHLIVAMHICERGKKTREFLCEEHEKGDFNLDHMILHTVSKWGKVQETV